jgi:hypothetical protein
MSIFLVLIVIAIILAILAAIPVPSRVGLFSAGVRRVYAFDPDGRRASVDPLKRGQISRWPRQGHLAPGG